GSRLASWRRVGGGEVQVGGVRGAGMGGMWLATVAESGRSCVPCRLDEAGTSCSGTGLGGSADNQEQATACESWKLTFVRAYGHGGSAAEVSFRGGRGPRASACNVRGSRCSHNC